MKQKNAGLIAAVIIVIVAVTAISMMGSSKTDNPNPAMSSNKDMMASAVETTNVVIKGYMFEPFTIKVNVGDTVIWTNQDSVDHNVIADTMSADAPNGPLIGKGETYKFTFNKAGTFDYHCGPHPSMHGTVEVVQ